MADTTITVTCGNLSGTLHMNRFLCPGIHQECIETLEGNFVTPKMFSVLGDKERLKDWKNAIRINGISVRKLMDAGDLEFFNHTENCTGRCISRLTGISKYDTGQPVYGKSDSDPLWTPTGQNTTNWTRVLPMPSASVTGEHTYSMATDPSSRSVPQMAQAMKVVGTDQNVYPIRAVKNVHIMPAPGQTVVVKQEKMDPEYSEMESNRYTENKDSPMPFLDADYDIDGDIEDPEVFWQYIVKLGLLNDFFREIKTSLDVLKNDITKEYCQPDDTQKLTNVVNALGLMTKLKWKLSAHKSETERQKEQLLREMEELKKKVAETENRQKVLKRKSEAFNELMEISRAKRNTNTPNSDLTTTTTTVTKGADDGTPYILSAVGGSAAEKLVYKLIPANQSASQSGGDDERKQPPAVNHSAILQALNKKPSANGDLKPAKLRIVDVKTSAASHDNDGVWSGDSDEEEEEDDEEEEEEEEEESSDEDGATGQEVAMTAKLKMVASSKMGRNESPKSQVMGKVAQASIKKEVPTGNPDLVITTRAAKKALQTLTCGDLQSAAHNNQPLSKAENITASAKTITPAVSSKSESEAPPSGGVTSADSSSSEQSSDDNTAEDSSNGGDSTDPVVSSEKKTTMISKPVENEPLKIQVISKAKATEGKKEPLIRTSNLIITTRAAKKALSQKQELDDNAT